MGLCWCGCGQPAPIATYTNRRFGHVKGQPQRFIYNHHTRLRPCRPVPERFFEKVQQAEADACWALALRGDPSTCILSAGALRDALRTLGHQAEVLRVHVSVHLRSDAPDKHGCVLGLIGGGGPRRAAGPMKWNGHLVTIADGRVLLDPTLDQVNEGHPWLAAEPMTWPVTPAFLAGTETFRVAHGIRRGDGGLPGVPGAGRLEG